MTANQIIQDKPQYIITNTIRMLCWSLGGNNDDSGNNSRIESKLNFKNQSSEIVPYAPAIAWHLADPMTLTNSSRVWWHDLFWSIKEYKELLMELLTFLGTNIILKAFSKTALDLCLSC